MAIMRMLLAHTGRQNGWRWIFKRLACARVSSWMLMSFVSSVMACSFSCALSGNTDLGLHGAHNPGT